MTECGKCGGRVIAETLESYRCDAIIGFSDVTVVNAAVRYRCAECGQKMGVHVPDPEGLEAAVAMTRIIRASKLSGTEFRSLRRACDLRAIELAEYLEVRPETISRWENDKEAIGPQFDKMMRFVVGSILADRAPGVPFDKQVITRMQIRHLTVSGVNKKEPFFFQRIKVRVNHRHETEWEPFDKAA